MSVLAKEQILILYVLQQPLLLYRKFYIQRLKKERRDFQHNLIGGREVTCLVETLCYMPEGRGFDSRLYNWIFFTIYLILPAALWPWDLFSL
jgi:hypothetical protein